MARLYADTSVIQLLLMKHQTEEKIEKEAKQIGLDIVIGIIIISLILGFIIGAIAY